MGFLANNICYSTAAEAADAYFSLLQPVLVKGGGSSDYYHFYSNVASVWYLDEYSVSSGGVFTLLHHGVLPLPSFAACVIDPLQSWDPLAAAAFWTFAFSFTVGLWFLAKNLGMILDAIKRF